MHLDDLQFYTTFLPIALAVFFAIRGGLALTHGTRVVTLRASIIVLLAASGWFVWSAPSGWLLLLVSAVAFGLAPFVERRRAAGQPRAALTLLVVAVTAAIAAFAFARWQMDGRTFAFVGITVICCHAIAYVIDVYRGDATATRPLESALYLIQFPALNGGPIVRSRDFSSHHLRLIHGISLGDFTYGVRRVVIGLVKILLVADVLGAPVDAIYALPASRLSFETAWIGAGCFALQIYFEFSGYADLAIGLGRIFGLRYPENFRRPYVADSVREFWRRWNITSIMWLRDYLSLPIAGRDAPTPRLLLNIFFGFCLIGLWHGGSWNVVAWALFSSLWLALEAVGLGQRIERLPRVLRHVYVLLVTIVGWGLLRAETHAHAWTFLQAMAGFGASNAYYGVGRFMSGAAWTALFVAVVGAGPLVPWISRWRVTVDAFTAAMVMMVTAFWLFVWRPIAQFGSLFRMPKLRRRT